MQQNNNCLEVLLLEEDLTDVLVIDPVQDVLLGQAGHLLVSRLHTRENQTT